MTEGLYEASVIRATLLLSLALNRAELGKRGALLTLIVNEQESTKIRVIKEHEMFDGDDMVSLTREYPNREIKYVMFARPIFMSTWEQTQ